jgi:hypothetical protein
MSSFGATRAVGGMRYSTGLKILAGVFGAGLLILIAGRQWHEARELLAGALLVGAIMAIGLLRLRPRRGAFDAEARRLGLNFSPKDPFGLLDEPFALLRWSQRSYGRLDNVLWGPWRGLQVRAFEYEYSAGEDDRRAFSCAMVAIPGGWPTLVIRPVSLASRLADVAAPDVAFESEAFDRAFSVRCEDRRFASAFVDARMIAWLLSLEPQWGFEIDGPWILGYRDRVQPWELESVLETMAKFIDTIPRVVTSMFPEALPPRPDLLG